MCQTRCHSSHDREHALNTPRALDVNRVPTLDLEWLDAPGTMTGHAGPWGHALPDLWRVLTDPTGGHRFLALPGRTSTHQDAVAYWYAVSELMIYHLGWHDPARGLDAWMAEGEPATDAPTLVLRDIFSADGRLHWLNAWFRSVRSGYWLDPISKLLDIDRPELSDRRDPDPDVLGEIDEDDINTPLVGGWDNLHLSGHLQTPALAPSRAAGTRMYWADDRRAVLLLDDATGWYRHLVTQAAVLPGVEDGSWEVEVIGRQAGRIGMFRRSTATGIWFHGRHRSHELGHR